MQEINYAGQESSAQSSGRNECRCRVCDGLVEWPDLVCRECWRRDREEQGWESYLDFLDSDAPAPGGAQPRVKNGQKRANRWSDPVLVVLCGPSHAGKTTFAKRLGENFRNISPDEVRERLSASFGDSKHETKVWDIYESMKRKALKERHNIVLDACHISKKARWHSLQGPNAQHRKICVIFDLPLQTIQERCLKEKSVSLGEVERMWRDFQNNKPTAQELRREGFDEMYFIREQAPEGKEAEATGLQYWFRYDLPFAKFRPYKICGGKKVKTCHK